MSNLADDLGGNAMKPVRVRFAPSPTGHLHLGGARTALYDYLLARQSGGQFILRIEDSDQSRYVPGAEQELMDSLRWLGLNWDEGPDVGGGYGPYRQLERKEIYHEYARKLIALGHAYYCFCTPQRLAQVREQQQKLKQIPRYDGLCRNLHPDEAERRVRNGERHVVRFKMPLEGGVTALDHLRGPITVEHRVLDDTILVRSDGLAVYHLAAMVDDYLMKITHVIRGAEWLPTFPLHAHIVRAFGWEEPAWVHLSIFLKPSGKGKLSKRDSAQFMQDGYSTYIKDLERLGYLPEAVINWIALMGWSYDDHTEFFTLNDLVEKFSLEKLNPSPAAINFTKFDHFNGLHLRSLAADDLARRVKPFYQRAGLTVDDEKLFKIAPLVQERLVTLDDAVAMSGFFFREEVAPRREDLLGKNMSAEQSAQALGRALGVMEGLADFSPEAADAPLRALAEGLGLQPGQLFGILRAAVTGQTVSPPLFESMAVMGRETALARVRNALRVLSQ
ncbi:MAG: glutamate--tRNA ligase [Chloroflexi bacterium]|nr:glutamate--tRNA ligase [Chloroflexota bacterium]